MGSVYIYLVFYFFNDGYDFFENFELYLGIYNLANLFENEAFLILIWTHFLAINLFCAAGGRSALAVKTLKEMGFKKVSHIEGGFGSMSNSGFKVIK